MPQVAHVLSISSTPGDTGAFAFIIRWRSRLVVSATMSPNDPSYSLSLADTYCLRHEVALVFGAGTMESWHETALLCLSLADTYCLRHEVALVFGAGTIQFWHETTLLCLSLADTYCLRHEVELASGTGNMESWHKTTLLCLSVLLTLTVFVTKSR